MIPRRWHWLIDLVLLAGAFVLAYLLFPALQPIIVRAYELRLPGLDGILSFAGVGDAIPPLGDLAWSFFVAAPAALLFLDLSEGHTQTVLQTRLRLAGASLLAPLVGLSLVALVQFALGSPAVSRIFLFSFAGLGGLGLMTFRLVVRAYARGRLQAGYYAKNVLVIGTPSAVEWLCGYFAAEVPAQEYRLLGYLDIAAGPGAPPALECLGSVADLGHRLIHRPIHSVIAVQPGSGAEWLRQVIRDCDYLRVPLWIVPEALLGGELRDLRSAFRLAGPLRLPAVVLRPREFESEALFLKRLFDIAVSAGLLILLAPVFLLIALAIKLTTPGLPVFYPWRVVGQQGRPFTGYKFTTMAADLDPSSTRQIARNEMSGPVFKLKDDPRITPLGRFLRKYSLNELPQLWSVLKGDMSLVGPRPAFPHELERYEFWHKRKLSVRPGLTCLWQIRGRNQISNFDDWVRLDLEYIETWSFWLDIRILVRTAWVVLAGTGS